MDNLKNKEKLIGIIKKLDIQDEIKNILINNIDNLDLKELVIVLKKYSERVTEIDTNNNNIKRGFKKRIDAYQNTFDEYHDDVSEGNILEKLINTI